MSSKRKTCQTDVPLIPLIDMHFFLSPSIYIGHIDMGFNTDKWTFAVIVDDQARLSTANLRKAPMISIRPVDFDACCVLYVLEFVLFFFLTIFFYFTGNWSYSTVNVQL